MKHALPLLTLVLASGVSTHAASPDWSQWRGPAHDGLSSEKGLLQDWPPGGPTLLWKATGLGEGYSTVAIAGPRIFTMGDKGDHSMVIARNLADGKPLWETDLGKPGAPGWGGFIGPRCMVTVDGDLLFAVGQYGDMACFNAETGKEIWRKDYGKDFGGQLQQWGYTAMPLVDGNKVILVPGGKDGDLVALDKKTGELIWRSKELADPIHYSSPIVAEIGGVRQYIQLTETSLAGVAAQDGRLLWRAARKGAVAVIPTPICQDNYVYVTSGYGIGCNLFKITQADGKFTSEQVYANKVMENHHGGVIKVGENVYGYSEGKGWTCQDFKTGAAVWQEKAKLGKGSIAYADGRFYLRLEEGKGTVALIEATSEGYKEHGRFDQPERSKKNSWPHPVIAGGKLYLRDQDILLCYDVKAK